MPLPIDAVGPQATLPADYDATRATPAARAQSSMSSMLDPQAFLQLLVAQLQYQDPTNPVDTSNFMNQTAMLSQVQSMTSMTSMLTDLAAAQQTQAATSMIGKQVSFLDPSGNPVAGVVSAISVRNGTSMLHVGDLAVPLSGVLEVTDPALGTAPTDPAGTVPTDADTNPDTNPETTTDTAPTETTDSDTTDPDTTDSTTTTPDTPTHPAASDDPAPATV